MKNHRSLLTVENFLYLAAFAVALALRLYHLNAHPLTDSEAHEALTAFRLLHGPVDPSWAPPHSPAYVFFTYFGFLVFGASDAIARLAPALCGAGLVFLPALFRDRLGRGAALLTGALLATSAGQLAASRSADGAIIALFGLGVGIAAMWRSFVTGSSAWLIAGAAALGLGLASGAAFLTGALIFALTSIAAALTNPDERETWRSLYRHVRAQAAAFLTTLGLAVVLGATVGVVYRPGLGALTGSGLAWLGGFAPSAAGRGPLAWLVFLLVYDPLLVVFGVLGAVRAFRASGAAHFAPARRFGQWLAWMCLIASAFNLLYPGRTLLDVIWIGLPLAALAGWAGVEIVAAESSAQRQAWPLVAAQVSVILLLLTFSSLNLASLAEQIRGNPDLSQGEASFAGLTIPVTRLTYLYLSGVAILLVLVVSYLFAVGWSAPAARLGLALSGFAALLVMGLSAGWGLTQLRAASPVELWWERPTADDLGRLTETLENVSNFSVGNERDVEATVQASPDGALGWALRDFTHARFVDTLDASVSSPVVIAPFDSTRPADQQSPQLGSAYVGQAFALRYLSVPAPGDWSKSFEWLVFRRAPVQAERVILWVRQDVQQLESASGK